MQRQRQGEKQVSMFLPHTIINRLLGLTEDAQETPWFVPKSKDMFPMWHMGETPTPGFGTTMRTSQSPGHLCWILFHQRNPNHKIMWLDILCWGEETIRNQTVQSLDISLHVCRRRKKRIPGNPWDDMCWKAHASAAPNI